MKQNIFRKMYSATPGAAIMSIKWMVAMTVLIIVALSFVGAPSVQAGDSKVYPGSMAVRYAGTKTPSISFSAIGNPSENSWLYVDLPIINDRNKGISRGWVRVLDMSRRYNVTCTLNSIYRSGSRWYGWSTPARSSSGKASYDQILTFGSVGGRSISHYYYSAKIPPMEDGKISYITSYRVNER
jgi:hypothetical protein